MADDKGVLAWEGMLADVAPYECHCSGRLQWLDDGQAWAETARLADATWRRAGGMPEPGALASGVSAGVREFSSGATRDSADGKLDFEGFISPLVTKRFAQYMHEHRMQTDGLTRASDNWQKGIPIDEYMKSLCRHFEDLRLHHDGYAAEATEPNLEKVLCAVKFNVDGYLFEVVKARLAAREK